MSNIILVAESGADIPASVVEKYHIHIVPMHVSFQNETKDDGSFPSSEVPEYFHRTHRLPKTSGSNIGDFMKVFDEIHESDPDAHILYLAYSSVTTVSYSCALTAMEGRDYVTAIDTKVYTVGQGIIVAHVAQAIEAHPEWTVEDAASYAKDLINRVHISFVPERLEFLAAGGRVKNSTALLAGLLHIHPRIDAVDGNLIAGKRYKGRMSRTIKNLVEDFFNDYQIDPSEVWFVETPGLDPAYKLIAEETAKAHGCITFTWSLAGSVITSHGGPGAFGIAGFSERKN